jgi:glycosyltransferase involved in cell wall biosynthesis
VRLLVYTDYVYRRQGKRIYAERAFALFLARLGDHFERLALAGRVDPEPGTWHYELPEHVELVDLPHYPRLSDPRAVAPALLGSLKRFWRALDGFDAVWILGPYPLSYGFVALAALRGKRVVLGVRQDWPRYVASRHPDRHLLKLAAHAMERSFRALARRWPVVVVGPELAHAYRRSKAVLPLAVSMVDERQIVSPDEAHARPWNGELSALSVGRIETEKNPLLLADVLARLDDRWRLTVCGDGPMRDDLEERLRELSVDGRAELLGYVPIDDGLFDVYRRSSAMLHVSWTEGLPQVLFEAFASGLPVVATAVGGVADAVEDAALLIPPGDAGAAAAALQRIESEPELRRRLVDRGLELIKRRTTQAEVGRLADFITR